jgi:plasmid stabilization system protein ParE
MRLEILPSALNDLRAGRQFYEDRQETLGEYFLDSLFSDIDSLVLYAGIHRKVFGYHRLLSKRFPFAVYYKMEVPETVVVWRILDMRRDPGKTRTELE